MLQVWLVNWLFFGDFWGLEPDLHSEFSNFQNLSVFSNFLAWNHILCHRYRQEKVQNTFFNTLEPLWKTPFYRTQLFGTLATVSYLSVFFRKRLATKLALEWRSDLSSCSVVLLRSFDLDWRVCAFDISVRGSQMYHRRNIFWRTWREKRGFLWCFQAE